MVFHPTSLRSPRTIVLMAAAISLPLDERMYRPPVVSAIRLQHPVVLMQPDAPASLCFERVATPLAPGHWEAELANVVWMATRAGVLAASVVSHK